MNTGYWVSYLKALGYTVNGTVHTPQNGVPEKNSIYVDGHHSELMRYGHANLTKGMWDNFETELTLLPPEVFFG